MDNNMITTEELDNLGNYTVNYLKKLIKDDSTSIKALIILLLWTFINSLFTLIWYFDLSWLILFEITAPFTIMLILTIKQLSKTAKTVYADTNIDNSSELRVDIDENGISVNETQHISYRDVASFFVPYNYIVINTKDRVSVPVKTDTKQQRQIFKTLWDKKKAFIVAYKKADGSAFRNDEIADSLVAFNRKIFKKRTFICVLTSIILVAITLFSVKLYKIVNRPILPVNGPFNEMYSAFEGDGNTQDISDVYIKYMFENYNAAIKSSETADNISKVDVYFFNDAENVYSLNITDYTKPDIRDVQYHVFNDRYESACEMIELEHITKTYPHTNNLNYYFLNSIIKFDLKNSRLFTADDEATYRFSYDKIEFTELCKDGENRYTIYLLNYTSSGEQAVNNYFDSLENECTKPYGLQKIDFNKIIGDIYAYSSY